MILVGQFDSPFVRRVAIALTHYGLPFERQVLSTFADFEQILAINPLGKVPALILEDGMVLIDSRAIIDFLEEIAAPSVRLCPVAVSQRRQVVQVEVVGVTLAEKIYERGIERTRRAPGTSDPAWCARLERQISSACAWLEARATPGWFFETGFSRADLAVAVSMQYLERVVPALESTAAYPKLHAHRRRCEDLACFKAVQDSPAEARRSGWTPDA
ncbi:MAG: glutathione S-transferase family protein [Pseudomonadota bacterium]